MPKLWCGNCLKDFEVKKVVNKKCPKCGKGVVVDPKEEQKVHVKLFHAMFDIR